MAVAETVGAGQTRLAQKSAECAEQPVPSVLWVAIHGSIHNDGESRSHESDMRLADDGRAANMPMPSLVCKADTV